MEDSIPRRTTQMRIPNDSDSNENPSDSDSNITREDVFYLLQNTWRYYNVSPLSRCEFDEVSLKRMAKWLREQLAIYMTTKSDPEAIIVKFDVIPKFSPSKNKSNALKVSLEKRKDNANIVAYEGLICRGSVEATFLVHALFQKMFDCKIAPRNLENHSLVWSFVVVILMTEPIDLKKDVIEFNYKYSNDNQFDVTLNLSYVKDIWKRFEGNPDATVTDGQIEAFRYDYMKHVQKFTGINPDQFLLLKVKTNDTVLTRQGAIRTKNPDAMVRFLELMEEFK